MGDYWVKVLHDGIARDDPGDAAILFKAQCDEGDEVWIPRSQCRDYDDEEMEIPQWLAEDRGLAWDYE